MCDIHRYWDSVFDTCNFSTAGGTWEHKMRQKEMAATRDWADELTRQNKGNHHIGSFLPPDELAKFMETYKVEYDFAN